MPFRECQIVYKAIRYDFQCTFTMDEIPFFVTQFNNSSERKITITEPLSHPCDQVPKRKRKEKFILVFGSEKPLIKVGRWERHGRSL